MDSRSKKIIRQRWAWMCLFFLPVGVEDREYSCPHVLWDNKFSTLVVSSNWMTCINTSQSLRLNSSTRTIHPRYHITSTKTTVSSKARPEDSHKQWTTWVINVVRDGTVPAQRPQPCRANPFQLDKLFDTPSLSFWVDTSYVSSYKVSTLGWVQLSPTLVHI